GGRDGAGGRAQTRQTALSGSSWPAGVSRSEESTGQTSQTALSGSSWPASTPPEVSSTSPGGSGTGVSPAFSAQTRPPVRRKARQPAGAPNHSTPSPDIAGCSRRSSSARRYSESVEAGSSSCASMVSSAQSSGIGSPGADARL